MADAAPMADVQPDQSDMAGAAQPANVGTATLAAEDAPVIADDADEDVSGVGEELATESAPVAGAAATDQIPVSGSPATDHAATTSIASAHDDADAATESSNDCAPGGESPVGEGAEPKAVPIASLEATGASAALADSAPSDIMATASPGAEYGRKTATPRRKAHAKVSASSTGGSSNQATSMASAVSATVSSETTSSSGVAVGAAPAGKKRSGANNNSAAATAKRTKASAAETAQEHATASEPTMASGNARAAFKPVTPWVVLSNDRGQESSSRPVKIKPADPDRNPDGRGKSYRQMVLVFVLGQRLRPHSPNWIVISFLLAYDSRHVLSSLL
jgi:hypothetical protein